MAVSVSRCHWLDPTAELLPPDWTDPCTNNPPNGQTTHRLPAAA